MFMDAPETGINRGGFITFWLSCEPYVTLPETDITDTDQLAFERKLRGVIADEGEFIPQCDVRAGTPACGGNPWKYKAQGGSCFIDYYHFYHLMRKAEVWAYTRLESEKEAEISAFAWTYTAADVFVNGEKVLAHTPPQYKPIKKQACVLPLKKGVNEIFVRLQTLGARDTRTLFALQLKQSEGCKIVYPAEDGALRKTLALQIWLDGIVRRGNVLSAPSDPPAGVTVNGEPWTAGREFTAPDAARLEIAAESENGSIGRAITFIEKVPAPVCSPERNYDARAGRLFDAMVGNEMNALLLRYLRGTAAERDDETLNYILEKTDEHPDCSDFTMNALLRLFKTRPMSEKLKEKFRGVALRYRYWMDEAGTDVMCFWSENHSILFYSNQYIAGGMFPGEHFVQSGLTGREAEARGRERCRQWLDSVLTYGFEEFLSSGYAPTTDAALCSLADFGDAEISSKAKQVLDKQLRQIALHSFRGVTLAPQGRVYGDVIMPHRQGIQGVGNLNIPGHADMTTTWLSAFADCSYRPCEGLEELANEDADTRYRNGNACITLKKTKDYLLTACLSPAPAMEFWDSNAYRTQNPDVTGVFSNLFVKALNEKFHGTSRIRPGVYGYQQHLMYAALSGNAVSFINHPGDSKEQNSMRPGYWFGNGILPAITRSGSRLAVIYDIEDKHPIGFTHVFWPAALFDESEQRGPYLFARKENGYMALWCSAPLTPHSDILQGCEYRAYSGKTAYEYTLGSREEYGSFEAFKEKLSALQPKFDESTLTFTEGDIALTYIPCQDDTQYVG